MSSIAPTAASDRRLYPAIVALVGPTAVGKSALALALARRYDAEIVSVDSRQVYRYMDIGTAKPTRAEQAEVRHHMLDLVAPDAPYSAQRFVSEGNAVLRRLAALGRPALVVGGTGFYLRALLDRPGFPPVPPAPEMRASLTAQAEREGVESIHRILAARDPRTAARIHPHNLTRVIRALEVVEALGAVPEPALGEPIPTLYLGLTTERKTLHRRIAERVRAQLQAGLVAETATLLTMGYEPACDALTGFGYREMVAHLQGRMSLADATERYTAATRQYARRQYTWFRADPRVQWLDIEDRLCERAATSIDGWLRP